MKQHRWHKEIKAWADGAEIESKSIITPKGIEPDWKDDKNPRWNNEYYEYRIKPQPKEDWVMICKRCGDELGIVYGEDNE